MARVSRKHQPSAETATITAKAPVYATYGYTRISRDGEHADDSIEGQTAIITEYAANHADIDLKGFYSDLGFSGTNFDRPSVQELIDGVKSGVVQCVVTKDLSRVGRSFLEVGELLFDTFPKYNVRYISVNDKYDSFADDAGRKKLFVLFKNLINSLYSKDLSKKIRSTKELKMQRGEPNGIAPYGYITNADKKRLEIDPEPAALVSRIFDMRLNGIGSQTIAKILTQEGVPTPKRRQYLLGNIQNSRYECDRAWSPSQVGTILRNEAYVGTLVLNKQRRLGEVTRNKSGYSYIPPERWLRFPNAHDAIIDPARFEAVRRIVDGINDKLHAKPNNPIENRYAGKLVCASCGRSVVQSGRTCTSVLYYYCRECHEEIKLREGLKKLSKLPSTALDAAVTVTLRTQIALLVDFEQLITEMTAADVFKGKKAELRREKARCERTLEEADKTLTAAYTHHLSGLLDFKEYGLVKTKAENGKLEAAAKLANIADELRRHDLHTTRDNAWLKEVGAFRDFFEQTDAKPTKAIIQALVKAIYVAPLTKDLRIELNYTDSFAELQKLAAESGVNGDV